MWPDRRLIDLLDIEHPIVLAPMAGFCTTRLAAEVCAGGALGSIGCGVMSPEAAVEVFSSSMFAVPTPPTSQPARVNGTHGAGVVFPVSVIMFGSESTPLLTGDVQYWNELANVGVPFWKKS